MNTAVISEYLPLYAKAFLLTVKIGWIGIGIALVIGVIGAFILYYRVPALSVIMKIYVELFRNTPLLVQLFFIYFGLPKLGIRVSAEVCGAAGLGLLGGSYMTEAVRSGLEAIPVSQTVIFPQAISVSVSAIVANVVFLLKETSVFSAISLMDLMFTAKDLIGLYYNTTECLVLLVLFYTLMLLPVSFLGHVLEKKTRIAIA